MAQNYSKTRAKFARLAALNVLIDTRDDTTQGARKAKKATNDSWFNRHARNAGDMFKRSNTKPGVCFEVMA